MPANSENKEKIELYLSMGATRWEACRPIAIEAMRRAMLPTINQMRYGFFYLFSFDNCAYTPHGEH
jgi:ABC-type iron transport system FetAB permease component